MMIKGLGTKLTGQIGEFLVCAELGKRGFIATSFTGNVPEFDLIAVNEDLNTVPIQVKTSRADSWPTRADFWINLEIDPTTKKQIDNGDTQIKNPDLIFICVKLAELKKDEKDRFFILTKKQLQKICSTNYREWMNGLAWKRPRSYESFDNRYYLENLVEYENNWDLVKNQLTST